jgi:Protein of unknown function (DUF2992)
VKFSRTKVSTTKQLETRGPKRAQREANTARSRPLSKAQEALRLEQEKNKLGRKQVSKEERDAAKERKYALKRDKAKQKKRGH